MSSHVVLSPKQVDLTKLPILPILVSGFPLP
jgi:hypothetical protein